MVIRLTSFEKGIKRMFGNSSRISRATLNLINIV